MKNITNFSIIPLLFMGVFLLFASSCEKDDDIPTLSTIAITDVTQTSATCGGNITSDGGATITASGVCWSTGETPTILDNKTIDDTDFGEFSSSLIGLSSSTTYYVRAYATNSNGTSYGSTLTFKTDVMIFIVTSFYDSRDGNDYQSAKMGNQFWMIENLKYLPSVVGPETESLTDPYYYVYGNNDTIVSAAKATDNYNTYGVLYNWSAAMVSCPDGWHLPSDTEWTRLTNYLGGTSVAGGKLKEKGTNHWNSPNTGATNESYFNALPGGVRFDSNGSFGLLGDNGLWWSATENSSSYVSYHYLYSNFANVSNGNDNKSGGMSVRCVKD